MSHVRHVPKRKMSGGRYAWALFGAGAVLVAYSLIRPANAGIPGWEPVNPSVRATLAAHASAAPGGRGQAAATRRPAASASAAAAVPAASAAAAVALPAAPSAPASAKRAEAAKAALLDLNSATEAELDALPGIGLAKAKAILAFRSAHKGFRKVDELRQVKGIGQKLFDRIRPLVTVAPQQPGG